MHIAYMSRSGDNAVITQAFTDVRPVDGGYSVPSVYGGRQFVPESDVLAKAEGRTLTDDEVAAVYAEHGHEQIRNH